MRSVLRVVKIVIFTLGVLVVLNCILLVGAYFLRRYDLPAKHVTLVMHDPATLMASPFVDPDVRFRIRLPAGYPSLMRLPGGGSMGMLGGDEAKRGQESISIQKYPLNGQTFPLFIASVERQMFESNDRGLDGDGRVSFNGMNGYELTYHDVTDGKRIEGRMVYINAGDDVCYMLKGVSPADQWSESADIFDSSFSTFEIGDFPAQTPPGLKIVDARGVLSSPQLSGTAISPSPVIIPQARNQLPPARAQHLNFTDIADALHYSSAGSTAEKMAALTYIGDHAGDADAHAKIIPEMLGLLKDATYRVRAQSILKSAATRDDVPLLRASLADLTSGDSDGRGFRDVDARHTLIDLLAKFGDADSSVSLAANMRSASLRDPAAEALKAIGPAAEPGVLSLLKEGDAQVQGAALKVIDAIGTEKSIEPLQALEGSEDPSLSQAAKTTLLDLANRLDLKPDQYASNLISRYDIPAPYGFTDDKVSAFNTREWSRKAPGRAVTSVYSVEVKAAGPGMALSHELPNAPTLVAGDIVFHQVSSSAAQFEKSAKFEAQDGHYVIMIGAQCDVADSTAATSMNTAAKKIRAKAPETRPAP